MIDVVILSSDMHEVQGVNKVTESLIRGYYLFKSYGVNLRYVYAGTNIIDCVNYESSIIGSNQAKTSYKLLRRIIVTLKRTRIYNSYAIQKILFERDMNVDRKSVVSYLNSNHIANVIFFQNPLILSIFIEESTKRNRLLREKLIVIAHNQSKITDNLIMNRPALKSSCLERKILNDVEKALVLADDIIVLGNTAQKYFSESYGLRTRVINNSVKPTTILSVRPKKKEKDGKIHIVSVGSLLYRKGMGFFPNALLKLSEEERSKLVIHIIGEGQDKMKILDFIKRNKLENCFEFLGSINNVIEVLQEMDVFMLPTLFDTMPIAILEAMMCGLPIVSTNVGEIPQMIIDNETGLLIEPNVESVKNALIRIIDISKDLEAFGIESKRLFDSKFSFERMIAKYVEVILDVTV